MRPRHLAACCALVGLLFLGKAPAQPERPAPPAGEPGGKPAGPAALEMSLLDGSTVKVTLRDERLEVRTVFGTLQVPASEVQSIEFGRRIPPAAAKKAEAAVLNLGSAEYKTRQAAMAELEALGERAYPALLRAEASNDKEVARRAKELLTRLRESVPEGELERPEDDVIQTRGMRLVGRLTADTLPVRTFAFGEQRVQLADVRSLGMVGTTVAVQDVQPDPGNLLRFQGLVGKSFYFQVTGGAPRATGRRGGGGFAGSGGAAGPVAVGGVVYGSGTYTTDSTLALAAVHAGVLKEGETGLVKVTVLGPQASFAGTTRNGVTSSAFGFYPASYKVSKAGR
jgi:hypothetical protein